MQILITISKMGRTLITSLPVAIALILISAPSRSQSTKDIGWPRQVTKNGNVLVYYQPQVDDWKDKKELFARAAFSLTPKGGKNVHGVASFKAGTLVDKDASTVYLRDITVTDVRFPSLGADTAAMMEKLFRELIPLGGEPISLERLMADVQANSNNSANTVAVNNDPPPIFYSSNSAVLLIVDSIPVMVPIDKTKLEFVANANWDLFYDKSKKDYYLLVESIWMTAKEFKGPWKQTQTLPKDMSKLPTGQNFDEVIKMIPPESSASAPEIFFSNKPAELIQLKGAPVYSKIPGTQLLYVTNTENDLFVDNSNQRYYILLSGRWFSSKAFSGPWTYAGNDLPKDFSKIPKDSPKANVLASVPGTVEAADAILLAQVPTTAIVNKADAEAKVKVNYDGGEPKFAKIEKTNMEYATNTQEKVIKVGDMYYLCFQAVWFMSTKPNGPWKVADTVPDEIYKIPSDSPVYNVTYVTQTNATSTTVESNTTAGYFGAFIIGVGVGACIAYGTGWYYPPYYYWGPGMMYPIYRPWPCTYGAGYVYNPWTGGYAGGRRVYGPYGAAGTSAWYNPATGRYGRSASVQGWYGGRTAASTYNPWTGTYASTRQGHNPYSQWGTSVATRGNQWVQTGHVSNANGTTAGYRTSGGQSGVIHTGANGTVARGTNGAYASHDGNVYHRDSNGDWKGYNNNSGKWEQSVGGSSSTRKELDGAAEARTRGETQTHQFQNFQHNGGGRLGGGGAGRMGGGGMRRR
ncbi:MAG: hypothetical protein C5B52_15330 [Bacteroidetes bacterium]|nr:MAG: hypothetical protein C5B52_15330 [Bacteroidota bacterium]